MCRCSIHPKGLPNCAKWFCIQNTSAPARGIALRFGGGPRNNRSRWNPIIGKPLLQTLHVQLDNCAKDNKCQYMVLFLVVACRKRNFQKGVRVFLDGGAHA